VQTLDDVERNTIVQALAQAHGNKKKAAQLLGIQRPTLYNKIKRYAIEL
jgi:DNA-binding NtrC family response regulator